MGLNLCKYTVFSRVRVRLSPLFKCFYYERRACNRRTTRGNAATISFAGASSAAVHSGSSRRCSKSCIEAAQGTGLFGLYPYAYRTADVDDLIYNTSGAALGWLCASALARVLPPGALAEEGEVTHAPGLIRRCVALWLDMTLMSVATLAVSAAVSLVLHNAPGAEAWADVPYVLLVAAASFVWTECVRPWRHGGSTPGGAFVRMSCETRERTGAHRAAFYAARAATLGAALLFPSLLWLLLALFYLVARKMPYDLI